MRLSGGPAHIPPQERPPPAQGPPADTPVNPASMRWALVVAPTTSWPNQRKDRAATVAPSCAASMAADCGAQGAGMAGVTFTANRMRWPGYASRPPGQPQPPIMLSVAFLRRDLSIADPAMRAGQAVQELAASAGKKVGCVLASSAGRSGLKRLASSVSLALSANDGDLRGVRFVWMLATPFHLPSTLRICDERHLDYRLWPYVHDASDSRRAAAGGACGSLLCISELVLVAWRRGDEPPPADEPPGTEAGTDGVLPRLNRVLDGMADEVSPELQWTKSAAAAAALGVLWPCMPEHRQRSAPLIVDISCGLGATAVGVAVLH